MYNLINWIAYICLASIFLVIFLTTKIFMKSHSVDVKWIYTFFLYCLAAENNLMNFNGVVCTINSYRLKFQDFLPEWVSLEFILKREKYLMPLIRTANGNFILFYFLTRECVFHPIHHLQLLGFVSYIFFVELKLIRCLFFFIITFIIFLS